MQLLLFLLLGTLIFGFAFPAMLFAVAFVCFVLICIVVWKFLTGNGGSFHVYTSRDFQRQDTGESRRTIHAESPPRHDEARRDPEAVNVAASEDDLDEECEVIELPATALRKDEEE